MVGWLVMYRIEIVFQDDTKLPGLVVPAALSPTKIFPLVFIFGGIVLV
jgi:hypothetical protein